MTEEYTTPEKPTFGQRMWKALGAFLRGLFKLLAILIILAVIGVIGYFGVQQLYRGYLGLQDDIVRVEDSQAIQEQSAQQLAESLETIKERLDALELQSDNQKGAFAGLTSQIEDIQATQEAYQEALKAEGAKDQAVLEEINTALEELEDDIGSLESAVEKNSEKLDDLQEEIEAIKDSTQSDQVPIDDLRRDLELVKVMELLTRSRLFLVENNLGLAISDIQSARDILEAMEVPDYQIETKEAIIERLELALTNLPASPELAAEDLEIAWQLLIDGFPNEPDLEAETTSTPSPQVEESTPTPTITPTPTPTP